VAVREDRFMRTFLILFDVRSVLAIGLCVCHALAGRAVR